ncbi:PH domain-containing protein [Haloechinothrix sp. YIM 98757]|uniref:PH domain-containing protein n=2 Tax=Haloechinothrix aidingensis TaxID=2752311 RepID=A0A838AAD0_9PSEU|nr:PH domain-containing protein [Haloechinothrix aidingensis]MBA0126186.1 PH domain-containing protein [Haloechinothrix aidingensis]
MVVMRTLVTSGIVLIAAVPAGMGIHAEGRSIPGTLGILAGGVAAIMIVTMLGEYLRWRATRFRTTPERFEWRFQLVVTRRRSLARERIRTVDITASPLHRIFGLATVVIGTGQQAASGEAGVKLDPVARTRAEALRVELLRRTPAAEPEDEARTRQQAQQLEQQQAPLATLDWRWAAYAPLSFLTPALGAAVIGFLANVVSLFGPVGGLVDDARDGARQAIADVAVGATMAVVLALVTLVLFVAAAGAVGAALLFVEMWWGYRLDREADGTLRVRRGLLTTRSISLEERRLRGVEFVEAPGVRLARAGRVDAVATGMQHGGGSERTDHKTLLPAAPRRTAHRVTSAVLDEPNAPTGVPLAAHPRAALVRRLRWSLAPVLVVAAGFGVAASLTEGWRADLAGTAMWLCLLGGVPIAALVAWDAYRNLGHALAGRYLVSRGGAARRSTVALQRSGVIGWTVRQSIFQRRVGLVTVTATTAAGSGGYQVRDVGEADGLRLAEEAVPDLLGPFVERTAQS